MLSCQVLLLGLLLEGNLERFIKVPICHSWACVSDIWQECLKTPVLTIFAFFVLLNSALISSWQLVRTSGTPPNKFFSSFLQHQSELCFFLRFLLFNLQRGRSYKQNSNNCRRNLISIFFLLESYVSLQILKVWFGFSLAFFSCNVSFFLCLKWQWSVWEEWWCCLFFFKTWNSIVLLNRFYFQFCHELTRWPQINCSASFSFTCLLEIILLAYFLS